MLIKHKRMSSVVAACVVATCFTATGAWGFAEEQTDPSTKANASTHHLYLTRALAACAGLDYVPDLVDPVLPQVLDPKNAKTAEIIAFNDEMTDIGTICTAGGAPCTGNGCPCDAGAAKWTNCTPDSISSAQANGDPTQCPQGSKTAKLVFPVINPNLGGAWQPQLGCFTQRFSPWSPLFHFPEDADLETIQKYASGESQTLEARAAYGWGGQASTMWNGSCYLRPTGTVPAKAVAPGTPEAFGIYLHSLADHDSHKMCRDQWTEKDKPTWYFHTLGPTVKNCGFNDHGFEFGCADSQRRAGFLTGTLNGAEHVYSALLQYSAKTGKTPRVASLDAHQQWLRRQLERYITLYRPSVLLGQNFQNTKQAKDQEGAAQCRIHFAWNLLQACVANASAAPDACLPDVTVDNSVCPAAGQVGSCPGGQKFFPVAPACSATPTQPAEKKAK